MIKIIKDGQKEFVGSCDVCGCQFSYDISDIMHTSIPCPCCGHYYVHKNLTTKNLHDFTITSPNSIPVSVTLGELQK